MLLETIEVLKELGVSCHVIVPGEGDFTERLRKLEVPYTVVRPASWVSWQKSNAWRRIKSVAKIAMAIVPTVKAIRDTSCDVVYSNTMTICHGAIAAAVLSKPHIWHLHEFPGPQMELHFGERATFRAIGALSNVCLVVSKHLASRCERYIDSSKIRVLYPSMHSDATAARSNVSSAKTFRCVIVGGLFELKRQHEAVQAYADLQRDGVEAELVVVGDGNPEYRALLEQIITENDLHGRVKFTGAVPEAGPLMSDSDAVLVCSPYETFGRVTVEGMLAGKPVVGARGAATPELIQDGFNGWLYEPGNSKDLAAKIKLLSRDRPAAARLGENGRTWAREMFTRDRYARELMTVISTLAPKN